MTRQEIGKYKSLFGVDEGSSDIKPGTYDIDGRLVYVDITCIGETKRFKLDGDFTAEGLRFLIAVGNGTLNELITGE